MKKIKILAHRGYSAEYPENTRLAFFKALENNAYGIECDVQKTLDNKYVIIHDDNIDRVSSKKGKTALMTLSELKNIDIGSGEKILELEELLKILPGDFFINFELKEETLNKQDSLSIFELISRYRSKEQFIISSFKEELLYILKNKCTIALLMGKNLLKAGIFKIMKLLFSLKPEYLDIPADIILKLGKAKSFIILILFKMLGYRYIFWTVDNEDQVKAVLNFADFLITNEVEKVQIILKKLGRI